MEIYGQERVSHGWIVGAVPFFTFMHRKELPVASLSGKCRFYEIADFQRDCFCLLLGIEVLLELSRKETTELKTTNELFENFK